MNGTKQDEVGTVTDGQIAVVEAALKRLGWEAETSQPPTPWGDTTFGRLTGLAVLIMGTLTALGFLVEALRR